MPKILIFTAVIKEPKYKQPLSNSLSQNFVRSYQNYPERPAFFVAGRYYSYSETLQLATAILARVNPSHCSATPYIGLYFQQNIQSYAALLAIAMSGAAYVPLNPKFPLAKNKRIMEKAKLSLVLYSGKLPEGMAEGKEEYLDLDKITPLEKPGIPTPFIQQDMAYLLFTSGTTGDPKGVPIGKENVRELLSFFLDNEEYRFGEQDRFLQVYELTFDVSVFSIFVPLALGACCYILPQKGIRYTRMLKMMLDHDITVVSLASTTLHFVARFMGEIRLPALRYCLLTADALQQKLAAGWSKVAHNARLENLYGPTEATVWCTRYLWEAQAAAAETFNGVVSIGKVLPSFRYLLVDEDLAVVPKGQAGELCVSGPQVVPNYLDNEKARSFFTKKIDQQSCRFYRTGDLVSENENGNLLFRGRVDNQVKINAYRIELGEVEAALQAVSDCHCAVVCHQPKGGAKALYAFLQGREVDKADLQKKLSQKLPDYMVPKHFFALDSLPVNLNGKLDRKHLISLLPQA